MAILSLICSLFLLVAVCVQVKRGQSAASPIFCGWLVLVFAAIVLVAFPAFFYQLLSLLVPFAVYSKWPPGTVNLAAVAGTALIYLGCSLSALSFVNDLRRQFPLEELDARLVRAPVPADQLGDEASHRLESFEDQVERKIDRRRVAGLKDLHERAVGAFINSPGFGVSRVVQGRIYGLRFEPVAQPGRSRAPRRLARLP